MRRRLPLLALALALAGCAPAPAVPRAVLRIAAVPTTTPRAVPTTYAEGPRVLVQLRAPGGRALQAPVPALTIADVDYVEVELYDEDPSPARQLAQLECEGECGPEPLATLGPIAHDDLDEPVMFGGLAPGVTYYLVAKAYREIGDGGEEELTRNDGSSETSFQVNTNGFAAVSLPIQLRDVAFSASTEVAVPGITSGGYTDPAVGESITLESSPL